MKLCNNTGVTVEYPNDEIQAISFPKAKDFSPEDFHANGVRPYDVIIHISFKDGSESTLKAADWCITEV